MTWLRFSDKVGENVVCELSKIETGAAKKENLYQRKLLSF